MNNHKLYLNEHNWERKKIRERKKSEILFCIQVANLAVSHDGKHVFTAGGTDATVHMWDVNLT